MLDPRDLVRSLYKPMFLLLWVAMALDATRWWRAGDPRRRPLEVPKLGKRVFELSDLEVEIKPAFSQRCGKR